MVCDFASDVHGGSVEDEHDAVLLSNCKLVESTEIHASDAVVKFLLCDYFALDCIPLDQQLVLSASEKLVFTRRYTQTPELLVEVAVHQHCRI